MDIQERNEVRTMMNDIIEPLRGEVLSQSKLTNLSLNNIDSHLEKLNGKVARHEKLINENLPHTTANCPQHTVIQEIHDALLSDDAVAKALKDKEGEELRAKNMATKKINDIWQKIVWVVLIGIALFTLWQNNKNNARKIEDTIKKEIREQEGISKTTRGGYVIFNDAGLRDSIKVR
jgi:hypothetical protein